MNRTKEEIKSEIEQLLQSEEFDYSRFTALLKKEPETELV